MKSKSEPGGDLSGFLDRDTQMSGELVFKETLRLDGKFQGSIRAGKNLVVGETAEVNADIEVGALYVSGRVEGKIRASERVELHRTARVRSDLVTPILVVEEGALFEGSCAMDTATRGPQEVAKPPRPAVVLKEF